MSVAARYINREIMAVFVVTLGMLLLVAVGGRFTGYLQEAALGKYTGSTVLTVMYLRMPEFIQLVAPFSIYVAIVLTFGRLYADQEAIIFSASGASTSRVLRWISISVLAVAVGVSFLSWYLTPLGQRALVEFMAEQEAQTEFETMSPGIFHVYSFGNRVTYSQSMSEDRRRLNEVFLAQRLESGQQATIWAETGRQEFDEQTGSHFLVLNNGARYEGFPGQPNFRILEFSELRQRLSVNARSESYEVSAQPTLELGDDRESLAEWHWRLALPLFCLIGGALGLGISRVRPREGRFARVVPGVVLMLVYYLALLMNKNALEEGGMPLWLGLWIPHLAYAVLAVYALNRLSKPVRA